MRWIALLAALLPLAAAQAQPSGASIQGEVELSREEGENGPLGIESSEDEASEATQESFNETQSEEGNGITEGLSSQPNVIGPINAGSNPAELEP